MRRIWILFRTEFNAWRRDPITVIGGVLPPGLILTAFAILFGGRLSIPVAFVNQDEGLYGDELRAVFDRAISPLNDAPYYEVLDMDELSAQQAYQAGQVDVIWLVPADFSARLSEGQDPQLKLYFNNYNDDRAKNHRIYPAEILWLFYENIQMPAAPLALAETYPRPVMVDWVPVIAVGIALLSVCLGSIFNMYALTYKEQINRITLEFGLAPRSLAWVLLPKVILALIFGLVSGMLFLGVIYLWLGFWPGEFLWAVGLLAGLTALFWIGIAIVVGLRARSYMAGAMGAVLGAIIVFFISGGMGLVRFQWDSLNWYSFLFPNTYAVDPIRDMVLFNTWPQDWQTSLMRLLAFATVSLVLGLSMTARNLRRLG